MPFLVETFTRENSTAQITRETSIAVPYKYVRENGVEDGIHRGRRVRFRLRDGVQAIEGWGHDRLRDRNDQEDYGRGLQGPRVLELQQRGGVLRDAGLGGTPHAVR